VRAKPGYGRGLIFILLVIIAVSAGGGFVLGWRSFHESGTFARLYVFNGGDLPARCTKNKGYLSGRSDREINEMRMLLSEQGLVREKELELKDLLVLQGWVGNQVKLDKPYWGNESGVRLIELARKGTGLACGSMSVILVDALTALGLPARRVQLYRTNFNLYDTHVLVEVRLKGRWLALDPTFNLTYELPDKTPLGVAEIQRQLASPGGGDVSAVYHGDRGYPARLDNYPVNWRVLFANAYVEKPLVDNSWWFRLPPMRYWFGPARYGFGNSEGPFSKGHNSFYFLVVVVLPFIAAMSGSGVIFLMFRRR